MESSVQSQKEGAAEPLSMEPLLTMLPEENRSEGKIGMNIYKKYFAAGANYFVILILLFLSILAQVAYVLQDWWLSYWATQQEKLNVTTGGHSETTEVKTLDLRWYLGIYAGLTVATILFSVVRCLLIFHVLVNAAQTLHDKMFQSILKAPVLFFDRNPIGRILNRFSKDIGHLDDLLPLTFLDFIQVLFQLCCVVGVAVVVIPWILIPLVPLFIFFIFLRRYFLVSVLQLEAQYSPICRHLFRDFGPFGHLKRSKDSKSCLMPIKTCFEMCFVSRPVALDAGQVGLALSYAVTLMGMFQWGVRQSGVCHRAKIDLKSHVI